MSSKNNPPIPLLIDTDNAFGMPVRDIDDGIALLAGLASEQVAIKAIVASACNCRAWESARNTVHLLDVVGRPDIPVGLGAEDVLSGDREAHHAYIESRSAEHAGMQYWAAAPTIPDVDVSVLPDGASLIIDTVRNHPHELVIILLGSMTNLALALRRAPDIAPLIKEIVHMGGSFTPRHGELEFVWDTADIPQDVWDTTLRFNTWYDKQATIEVLSAGIATRFISANVTSHCYIRKAHVEELRTCPKNRISAYLLDFLEPWLRWSIDERKIVGAHMHDPLTVLSVVDPTLCSYRNMEPDVVGFKRGYELFPQNEEMLWKTTSKSLQNYVRVAVNVDVAKAEQCLLDLLKRVLIMNNA